MKQYKNIEFFEEYKKFGDKYIEEKFLKKEGFDDSVIYNLREIFSYFIETYLILRMLNRGFKVVKKNMYRKFSKENKKFFNLIVKNLDVLSVIFDCALNQCGSITEYYKIKEILNNKTADKT